MKIIINILYVIIITIAFKKLHISFLIIVFYLYFFQKKKIKSYDLQNLIFFRINN